MHTSETLNNHVFQFIASSKKNIISAYLYKVCMLKIWYQSAFTWAHSELIDSLQERYFLQIKISDYKFSSANPCLSRKLNDWES